jgi:VanZ family protein
MSFRRRLALWGPVVVWAGLIFALSSIPSLSTGLGTWDEILRKCAHVTEYAVLGFLLMRAIGQVLPALVVGILYAATDELHQHFVRGRHPSPFDVAFDACGVALGLLAYLSVESKRGRAEKELRRPPAGRRPRAPRRPARGAPAAEQPTRPH